MLKTKNGKDDKIDRWHLGCCCHSFLERVMVKPLMQLTSRCLCLSSWWFKPKGHNCCPRTGFFRGWLPSILCLLNPEHDSEASRQLTTHAICQILSRKLFSVPEIKFGAGWNLVTGQLHDELWGDHPNHRQWWGHHCLLTVVWVLQ